MKQPYATRFSMYQRAVLKKFCEQRFISDFHLYRIMFSPGEVRESYMKPFLVRLARRGFVVRDDAKYGWRRAVGPKKIMDALNGKK